MYQNVTYSVLVLPLLLLANKLNRARCKMMVYVISHQFLILWALYDGYFFKELG